MKQVCHPMFEPKVCRKQMYCLETKCSWHCWNFIPPRSDSSPGELCYAMKIGEFSKSKQSFKSERHKHLQFSKTIRHGSCTDCQKRLPAAFQVSSCSFVSLPCLPHAFLRRGPVFINFSDIQQVTFLRLHKFENNFWIVLEVRFRSVNVPVSLDNGENEIYPKSVWLSTVFVKKVTWAVGLSLLCSQYTSGWTRPWAPPLKNPASAYDFWPGKGWKLPKFPVSVIHQLHNTQRRTVLKKLHNIPFNFIASLLLPISNNFITNEAHSRTHWND